MKNKSSDDREVPSELIFVPNQQDGHPILCRVWTPSVSLRGAVFFIHGGMFSKGNLNSHPKVSRSLAMDLGLAVITASFRDGSSTRYSSGETMEDLKSIARYFRKQHAPLPFGIVGSSSGGWFALAVANALEHDEVDFIIPLCPVSDPYERAVYLKHCIDPEQGSFPYHVQHEPDRAKFILDNQMLFFETMENMQLAAKEVHSNRHNVPTLLIVGAADKNVPPQVTQHIQDSWATRTISIGGAGHEIQNAFPNEMEKDFVPDIDRFLTIVLKEMNNTPISSPSRSSRQFVLAILLLIAAALLFALSWWMASILYEASSTLPSNHEEWLSGYKTVYKPFTLVMETVEMILKGGARNRDTGGFMVFGSEIP